MAPRRATLPSAIPLILCCALPMGCTLADPVPETLDLILSPVREIELPTHDSIQVAAGPLALLPQGRLALGDPTGDRIVFFDAEGELFGSVGRTGMGPNEFRSIVSVVALEEGIAVYDARQWRVTYLGLDGTLVGTSPLYPEEYEWAVRAGPGSVAVVTTVDSGRIRILPPFGFPSERTYLPVRKHLPEDLPIGGLVVGGGAGGRVYVGWAGGEYRIAAVDREGNRVAVFERGIGPRPLTPEEVEAAQAHRAQVADRMRQLSGSPVGEDWARLLVEGEHAPDALVRPHFTELGEDPCGRLWVLTGRALPGGTIFDVFARDGALLAEVAVPRELESFDVDRTRLAGVVVPSVLEDEPERIVIANLGRLACGEGP